MDAGLSWPQPPPHHARCARGRVHTSTHIRPNASRNNTPGSTFGQTVHSGMLVSEGTDSPSTTPVTQITMNVGTYTAAQTAARVANWNAGVAHPAASGTISSAAPCGC